MFPPIPLFCVCSSPIWPSTPAFSRILDEYRSRNPPVTRSHYFFALSLSFHSFTRQPLHDEYSLPKQHCVILFGLWLFSFNLMIKEGRDEVISGMKTERDLEIVFWTKVAVKKIVTHLELIFWFVIYLWVSKRRNLGVSYRWKTF